MGLRSSRTNNTNGFRREVNETERSQTKASEQRQQEASARSRNLESDSAERPA
jgi:hypothetical protein